MKSSRFALCVLLFLTTTLTTVFGTASDEGTVTVRANDSVTLSCSGSHSGIIEWVRLRDTGSVVAECNLTSCWSKAGYQISLHQCQKKNCSLKVVRVDPNNIGLYKCKNEDRVIRAVHLLITGLTVVTAEQHGSAVLPCDYNCSGEGRWIRNYNDSDVLAECDQITCRSTKTGYQMSYGQSLNLSLIIPDVDYTMTGYYTCQCDRMSISDVQLLVGALNSTVQVKPGDSLVLELERSDKVEVVYNSTGPANGSSGQICTVEGGSLQCRAEYSQRTSLPSVLELRGMDVSDSGVYIVRDSRKEEVIHVYTVSVRDADRGAKAVVWTYLYASLAVNVVLGLAVIGLLGKCMKVHRPCGNQECVLLNPVSGRGDADQGTEEEAAMPPPHLE